MSASTIVPSNIFEVVIVLSSIVVVIPVNPEPSPTKDVADMVPVEIIAPELIVPVKFGDIFLTIRSQIEPS